MHISIHICIYVYLSIFMCIYTSFELLIYVFIVHKQVWSRFVFQGHSSLVDGGRDHLQRPEASSRRREGLLQICHVDPRGLGFRVWGLGVQNPKPHTLNPKPSTLNPKPWTLNPGRSVLSLEYPRRPRGPFSGQPLRKGGASEHSKLFFYVCNTPYKRIEVYKEI